MSQLLTKGLEEEVYAGTSAGRVVAISNRVAADLPGFTTEPDARNIEYTTAPYREYRTLIDRLMSKRCLLRRYLKEHGDYTLIPGSTLSLEPDSEFHISDPNNAYYRYIRDQYGSRVVTASTHINIGIEAPEEIIRAYRVMRCEASLFLALTAASPFLAGEATGFHSTRWHIFPETPAHVPFFTTQDDFVEWFERQLVTGTMQNPRHLWLSVRPNGPATPYELTRLELRICERLAEPALIAAVVGLYEARVWQILEDPDLDPLVGSSDPALRGEQLIDLVRSNEAAAARSSLEAEIVDWRSGQRLPMRQWIEGHYDAALRTAAAHGFDEVLPPLRDILEHGNTAQRWLARHARGSTPQQILSDAIEELAQVDHQYDHECPAVLG